MAARALRPEIRVLAVRFSPTGESWGAVTTEGLLIYSLDPTLVFEPFQLEEDITEGSVLAKLAAGHRARALIMALHLNLERITRRVVERVPLTDVESLAAGLPHRYVEKLLAFVSAELEGTRHLEFYVQWAECLVRQHAGWLRAHAGRVTPLLRHVQKALTTKLGAIGKICDHNKYLLSYLSHLGQLRSAEPALKRTADSDSDSDSDVEGAAPPEPVDSSDSEAAAMVVIRGS
ncbi:Periodic tryptophan protein 2 [Amphibalanus amphitrite]|uniref:Periodic tryptophan protein 2 n=1 Tax=Amphibalanus amphitrite TaxID=1232801 RepID=A0A6A4VVX0_AMPAM|nr:Periodic tryptophan protein 2 [Amphibalanus amphitrite]KAF0297794.1 Periodic tryptophan protein 2 [Amphibalanus amphitrite]